MNVTSIGRDRIDQPFKPSFVNIGCRYRKLDGNKKVCPFLRFFTFDHSFQWDHFRTYQKYLFKKGIRATDHLSHHWIGCRHRKLLVEE